MSGFTGTIIGIWSAPVANWFPFGTIGHVPIVHRGATNGLKYIATRLATDRSHGNRVVWRAECGGSNAGDIGIHRPGKSCQPVYIAKFSLISGHPQRGVALGMFNTDEPFLRRQTDVGNLDVILIVQPRLFAQLHARTLRHQPYRCQGCLFLTASIGRCDIRGQLEPKGGSDAVRSRVSVM